jgi:SAM-dependent methyltransferase
MVLNMSKNTETQKWLNTDNADFHEKIPIDEFKQFVKAGGFDDDKDIDLIMPYLIDSHSIIELGAGYGRVIGALRKRGYGGKITAIERSKNFFSYLTHNYLNESTILMNDDIYNMSPSGLFDVVLYMWCNISEWPKEQQSSVVKNISTWAKPGGLLILETIDASQKPLNSIDYTSQTYAYKSQHGTVQGYIPTEQEIDNYINDADLMLVDKIDYITKTERERTIYILRRV